MQKLVVFYTRAMWWIFVAGAVVILPLVSVLTGIDAGLRYVAAASIRWSQDFSGLMLFTLFCMGLPYSWIGHFHVRMDMVYDNVAPPIARALDALAIIGGLVFGALFCWHAVTTAQRSYTHGTTMPSGDFLVWPFQAMSGLAAALLCGAIILAPFGGSNQGSRS